MGDGVRMAIALTSYPFLKALKAAEGGVDYAVGAVLAYDKACDEADMLKRRLGDMMQHVAQRNELLAENQRLRRMLAFTRSEPAFTLEPAEVIESFKGSLVIDRGALHGIRESMCVVTEEGIVGLITKVDALTANVATLHSVDCKIGGMILRNRVRGMIHGSSSDLTRYCTMRYIDLKDDVGENDRVVTSPESIFPSGYPIGRVDRVNPTGSLWRTATVEPAVDPYRLDEVFVLRQAVRPARELAGAEPPEAPRRSVAPLMPDTRSLQDWYAP